VTSEISGTEVPVSVGLPVYNGARYVREAVDSILRQSFGDFELIISDNASTDDTEAICRDYAARDKRVRFYRHPENLGASKNFESVFRLSRGRYFRWCAADDWWEPELLAKAKEILDRRPDVVLAYPRTRLMDARGALIRLYDGDLEILQESPAERFREVMSKLRRCHAMFGLMRSEVLRRTSLVANYSGSDQVLLAQLAILGKIHLQPEFLFNRRFHEASSSSDLSVESQQQFYDPRTRGKLFLRYWRHTAEHWKFVLRADLPSGTRFPLFIELLRQMRWNRGRLGRELLHLCSFPLRLLRRRRAH